MALQTVVITKDAAKINALLEQEWRVVSVTAQQVGTGYTVTGAFCFLLEKKIKAHDIPQGKVDPYLGPEV